MSGRAFVRTRLNAWTGAGDPSRRLAIAGLSTLTGALLALSATPASSEEIGGLRSMNLDVHGRLDQRCALGAIDSVDFGDLTHPGGRARARVALDCNVPISVTVSAAHGALANERYPQGQGPYAGSVPYSLGFKVPVRHPWESVMLRSFKSSDLVGVGQTFTTGDGIAVDGMSLEVALEKPSGDAGLLAGSYGETIEITVTPG
jgi:spore coat protein U-like protein